LFYAILSGKVFRFLLLHIAAVITRMEIREDCTGEKCIRQLRVTGALCDTWVSTYHMTNLYEATHIDREENATFKRDVPFRSAVRCVSHAGLSTNRYNDNAYALYSRIRGGSDKNWRSTRLSLYRYVLSHCVLCKSLSTVMWSTMVCNFMKKKKKKGAHNRGIIRNNICEAL